jgi:hypothetical protein
MDPRQVRNFYWDNLFVECMPILWHREIYALHLALCFVAVDNAKLALLWNF